MDGPALGSSPRMKSHAILATKKSHWTATASSRRSTTSTRGQSLEIDELHPLHPSLPLPAAAAASAHSNTTSNEATAAAAASSVSPDVESEQMMFEEQVRVLSVSVNELHALLQQRRQGDARSPDSDSDVAASAAQQKSKSHVDYAGLSEEVADSLTSHYLLTSNLLIRQLTQRWTDSKRPRTASTNPSSDDADERCHDPSLLPWPKQDSCPCRSRQAAVISAPAGRSGGIFGATTQPRASSNVAPTPVVAASSIRRMVLPFKDISLIEKDILGTSPQSRTKSPKQPPSPSQPPSPQAQSQPEGEAMPAHLQFLHGGSEAVDPRDVQLLYAHFSHLLTDHRRALLPPSGVPTPLALMHPFGLAVHEFATQFAHQLDYLHSLNAGALRPRVLVDRAFIKSQIGGINAFLAAHETLVLLAYPRLSQTVLAQKILRSVLRSCVLGHRLVLTPLAQWYTTVHAEEDTELAVKVDDMREVSLSDMGVMFPYNLDGSSMLKHASVGVVSVGSPSPDLDDDLGLDLDEEDALEANVHGGNGGVESDVEEEDEDERSEDDGMSSEGEAEHGIHQASPGSSVPRDRGAGPLLPRSSRFTAPWGNGPALTTPNMNVPGASRAGGGRKSNPLAFLSASPRLVTGLPAPSLRRPAAELAATPPSPDLLSVPSSLSNFSSPSFSSPSFLSHSFSGGSSSSAPPLPYSRSIRLLSTIDSVSTVDGKLDILVRVCRLITHELHAFLERHGLEARVETASTAPGREAARAKQYSITCDDLFQIFAFCMLHAQISAPVATVNMLSDLIEGHQLNGEGGYCLTTAMCAIQLILEWTPPSSGIDATAVVAAAAADAALPSLSASSNTSSPTLSAASSFTGGSPAMSPLKPVGSPSSDAALFAPLLASNLAAFYTAADYLSLDPGWEWLFEKHGVVVHRKMIGDSPIASIKGSSIIHRPSHILQAFLKNINSRQHIDDLYIGGRVLAHLDTNTKLVHYRFKARNWCARQQTDMVLLLHSGMCSDGVTHATLAFSVPHPSCPPAAPFQRATVRASGWLLKPTNGGTSTHVTYIVAPDGNGYSAWVVNLLSTKQPMIIRNMRDYIYATTTADDAPRSNASTAPSSPSRASSRRTNSYSVAGTPSK